MLNWLRCVAWTRHLFTLRFDKGHGESVGPNGRLSYYGLRPYVNFDPHWHASDYHFIGIEVSYGWKYFYFGIKDSPSKCPGRS